MLLSSTYYSNKNVESMHISLWLKVSRNLTAQNMVNVFFAPLPPPQTCKNLHTSQHIKNSQNLFSCQTMSATQSPPNIDNKQTKVVFSATNVSKEHLRSAGYFFPPKHIR